ncbi:MAG TPA: hydrogenase maturation protease [Chroococcales cyanobacterium]
MMQAANQCSHNLEDSQAGLALVTIGNSLRSDDGVALALCDALPHRIKSTICRFDLGSHIEHLAACLKGHHSAVVVDSTQNGSEPGTVSILNLALLLESTSPLRVESCHGLSLADELRLAKREVRLPDRLIFFGIEANDVSWSESLTPALQQKLPGLVKHLSSLLEKILESLKRHA